MTQNLKPQWLKPLIAGQATGLPVRPTMQVLSVDPQPGWVYAVLSDRQVSIKCAFSEASVAKYKQEWENESAFGLKGNLISVDKFRVCLVNGEPRMLVLGFSVFNDSSLLTIGDPCPAPRVATGCRLPWLKDLRTDADEDVSNLALSLALVLGDDVFASAASVAPPAAAAVVPSSSPTTPTPIASGSCFTAWPVDPAVIERARQQLAERGNWHRDCRFRASAFTEAMQKLDAAAAVPQDLVNQAAAEANSLPLDSVFEDSEQQLGTQPALKLEPIDFSDQEQEQEQDGAPAVPEPAQDPTASPSALAATPASVPESQRMEKPERSAQTSTSSSQRAPADPPGVVDASSSLDTDLDLEMEMDLLPQTQLPMSPSMPATQSPPVVEQAQQPAALSLSMSPDCIHASASQLPSSPFPASQQLPLTQAPGGLDSDQEATTGGAAAASSATLSSVVNLVEDEEVAEVEAEVEGEDAGVDEHDDVADVQVGYTVDKELAVGKLNSVRDDEDVADLETAVHDEAMVGNGNTVYDEDADDPDIKSTSIKKRALDSRDRSPSGNKRRRIDTENHAPVMMEHDTGSADVDIADLDTQAPDSEAMAAAAGPRRVARPRPSAPSWLGGLFPSRRRRSSEQGVLWAATFLDKIRVRPRP